MGSADTVVFAGRERGMYTRGDERVVLNIRTSRFFAYGDGG